jgi:hypothetical protein
MICGDLAERRGPEIRTKLTRRSLGIRGWPGQGRSPSRTGTLSPGGCSVNLLSGLAGIDWSGKNDRKDCMNRLVVREERMRTILRIVLGSLAAVAVCVWLAAGAYAASPEGMRLYVFSSGWLNLDKSGLQTGATGKISVPVAFFLIKHPKGNVLFDTGTTTRSSPIRPIGDRSQPRSTPAAAPISRSMPSSPRSASSPPTLIT